MTFKDFKCIKNYILENGKIAFTKNETYELDTYMDSGGVSNQGDYIHLSKVELKVHFKGSFKEDK